MNAAAILFALARDGLTVTLAGENLRVVPGSSLTASHRALIAENKAALVALLGTAHQTVLALIAAVNRCCDARGDDDCNRAALVADCKRLAPHEQADMREHFDAEAKRFTFQSGPHSSKDRHERTE